MFAPQAHRRLQIHAIKTYSASNLNRDDLGAPKEVVFGGVRRLRISSQSLKRSVRVGETFASFRTYAKEAYGSAAMVRTREIARLLRERLEGRVSPAHIDATVGWVRQLLMGKSMEKQADANKKAAAKAAKEGKVHEEEDDGEKTQLIALSEREVDLLCDAVVMAEEAKGVVKAIESALADRALRHKSRDRLAGDFSIEAQLFGRMMTAEKGFESIDAPLQVAHAFTTHAVAVQRDYWTGVDDNLVERDETGSGHIDVRKFGSGTFYLYSCLDLDLLEANIRRAFPGLVDDALKAAVRDTALAWLQGTVLQNPTGYQNSFAAHDLASAVAVEIGSAFPYSAAKAFERPVKKSPEGNEEGFDRASVEALLAWDRERQEAYRGYVAPLQGYGLGEASTAPGLGELVQQIGEQLMARAPRTTEAVAA